MIYEITLRIRVQAPDCDEAQEQAFALCDKLSPAPSGDVGSPPNVREIKFSVKDDLREVSS